jgi:hypothetical protein
MFGKKTYFYLIDRLTLETGKPIREALLALDGVEEVKIHPNEGILAVKSKRDMEEQVNNACNMAGLSFRTKVNPKQFR